MKLRTIRFKLMAAQVAAIFTAMAMPVAFGKIYVSGDLGMYYVPLRYFYARCLANGDDFTWCPNLFCGYYAHGEGQIGMYHPLHLALYGTLPFSFAYMVDGLIWYLFMLIGMYLFLRRHTLGRDAALFGSLTFAFSTFNLLHFGHMNAIAVTSHIPWLLAMVDIVVRDQRRGWVTSALFGTSLLTTSQVLHGYPQYLYLSFLAESLYLLLLLPSRAKWWRLLAFAGAVALGLLGGSIQLLPSFDALSATSRDFSVQARYTYSLHPANLAQLVSPFLFRNGYRPGLEGEGNATEFTIYNGGVATVLIMWVFLRRNHLGRLRPLAVSSFAFGGLALILALGSYGYLYRFQVRVPLIGIFRVPARHVMLFQLASGILASIGFAELVRSGRRRDGPGRDHARLLWLVPAAGIGISLFAIAAKGHVDSATLNSVAPAPQVLAGLALIVAATSLVVATANGMRFAWAALVLFAISDQFYAGFRSFVGDQIKSVEWLMASAQYPPHSTQERVHHLLAEQFTVDGVALQPGNPEKEWRQWQNIVIMSGIRIPSGYCGLVPQRELEYLSGLRPQTLRAAGIRWVCIREQLCPKSDCLDDQGVRWHQVPNPTARARLVTRVLRSEDPKEDIELTDVSSVALVASPLYLRESEPGHATISDDRPGSIDIRTSAPAEQLLVVSESYHSGWQASLDGQPVPIIRVYGDFMGCLVGQGQHRVELRFRPRSRTIGAWLSATALVLMTIQFGLTRRLWGSKSWSLATNTRQVGDPGRAHRADRW